MSQKSAKQLRRAINKESNRIVKKHIEYLQTQFGLIDRLHYATSIIFKIKEKKHVR
jgi:hypothetical protein